MTWDRHKNVAGLNKFCESYKTKGNQKVSSIRVSERESVCLLSVVSYLIHSCFFCLIII